MSYVKTKTKFQKQTFIYKQTFVIQEN